MNTLKKVLLGVIIASTTSATACKYFNGQQAVSETTQARHTATVASKTTTARKRTTTVDKQTVTSISKQRAKIFVNVMLSYAPKTKSQQECLSKFRQSKAPLEQNAEQQVINKCGLQKLTSEQQARVRTEMEKFVKIMNISNRQERFTQFNTFYNTRPRAWAGYVEYCRKPSHTGSSDCDYYRYVVNYYTTKK